MTKAILHWQGGDGLVAARHLGESKVLRQVPRACSDSQWWSGMFGYSPTLYMPKVSYIPVCDHQGADNPNSQDRKIFTKYFFNHTRIWLAVHADSHSVFTHNARTCQFQPSLLIYRRTTWLSHMTSFSMQSLAFLSNRPSAHHLIHCSHFYPEASSPLSASTSPVGGTSKRDRWNGRKVQWRRRNRRS